ERRGAFPDYAPGAGDTEFDAAETGLAIDSRGFSRRHGGVAQVDFHCAESRLHLPAGKFLAGDGAFDFAEDGGFVDGRGVGGRSGAGGEMDIAVEAEALTAKTVRVPTG